MSHINLPMGSVKKVMASFFFSLINYFFFFCEAAISGIPVFKIIQLGVGWFFLYFYHSMWCWRITVDQVCLPHQDVRKLWFVLSTTIEWYTSLLSFGTLQFTMGHSVYISCHNGKWLIYLRINKYVISADIVLVLVF